MIPAEAVGAIACRLYANGDPALEYSWRQRFISGDEREKYMTEARTALEAAAPYMQRGDGDYRPGWDDRKTLSGLWQEHAPLPDEGLSERVYEALIEVAAWGYQQRLNEEL